jgi:hypothetical protein
MTLVTEHARQLAARITLVTLLGAQLDATLAVLKQFEEDIPEHITEAFKDYAHAAERLMKSIGAL